MNMTFSRIPKHQIRFPLNHRDFKELRWEQTLNEMQVVSEQTEKIVVR